MIRLLLLALVVSATLAAIRLAPEAPPEICGMVLDMEAQRLAIAHASECPDDDTTKVLGRLTVYRFPDCPRWAIRRMKGAERPVLTPLCGRRTD